MRKVTKQEFKDAYFKLGGERDGWTADYWEKFYAAEDKTPMAYSVEEPPTPAHNRMMIVSDAEEHRLFFLTEESEESFFGPETD